jgi:hypothetical protein
MSEPTPQQNTLQAMQARILQLEEHAHQVNRQFETERTRFENELREAKEANSSQSMPPVKIPLPDFYDGHPLKLNDWLFQIQNFFNLVHIPESKMVSLAVSLLRGSTLTWWRNLSPLTRPAQFQDFQRALTQQFQIDDETRLARDLLAKLSQNSSVHSYTETFRSIILQIQDMTDAEAKDRYMRGLKPKIAKEVLLRDCKDLNDMIKIAERFDYISDNTPVLMPKPNFQSSYSPNSNANFATPALDIMDVDAVHISEQKQDNNSESFIAVVNTRSPRNPITDAERRQLSRNQACFYCRQRGHFKRDCPTRPSRHQGNGGQRQ